MRFSSTGENSRKPSLIIKGEHRSKNATFQQHLQTLKISCFKADFCEQSCSNQLSIYSSGQVFLEILFMKFLFYIQCLRYEHLKECKKKDQTIGCPNCPTLEAKQPALFFLQSKYKILGLIWKLKPNPIIFEPIQVLISQIYF